MKFMFIYIKFRYFHLYLFCNNSFKNELNEKFSYYNFIFFVGKC